jgi:WD40 repeat protein
MTSILSPSSIIPRRQIFGEPQLHTDGELAVLTFAPDGTLWSVEEPGVLRHWNAESGEQLDWQSLSDLETLWCFSGDARVLASASNDLTLWDVSSGQILTAVAQDSWVDAMALHPDPMFLVTGHDDGVVRLWDLSAHQGQHTLRHHQKPISAAAFSSDGSKLAVASEDKTITLWDTKSGKLLGQLQGHTDRIPALAWHPSGKWLVSAGWDTTARVWDVATLQPAILLNTHGGQVTALAFSADGKLLACADSNLAVHVWDFDAKKTLHVLHGPQSEIRTLAFNKDSGLLACNGDRLIHLWEPRTGKPRTSSAPHSSSKTSVSLSPSGAALAASGGGQAARVWNVSTRKAQFDLESPQPVYMLAYSPDGKFIAGALGKQLRLWDAATGQVHADWEGPEQPITTLAFSPDSRMLATASATDVSVWLWQVADGEPVLIVQDALQGCTIEALTFHPDGQRVAVGGIDHLATGGSDGAVALWNIPGRFAEVDCFEGARALAVHPDGKRLAFATLQQSIGILDFASQQLSEEFIGHDGQVTALAFSPDGKMLASGSEDRTLRLWSETGEELAVADLDSQITSLAYSPDGQFLYTGNANTTCSQVKISDLLEKKS